MERTNFDNFWVIEVYNPKYKQWTMSYDVELGFLDVYPSRLLARNAKKIAVFSFPKTRIRKYKHL